MSGGTRASGRSARRILGAAPPTRRRRGAWMALGFVAAVVVSTALLSLTIEGATGGTPGPRRVGAIDPHAFHGITRGTLAWTVRARFGRPRERQRPPLRLNGLDCWTYSDASGSPMRFRFCFRRGALVSKSRIPPPAAAGGDGTRRVSRR